jgi:hypothetical protein
MKNQKLQDFLIALSLSNLLFIRSWRRLIYPSSEAYHIKLEPYPADYLGAILSVLITAGLFFGGIQLARYLNGGKTPTIAKLFFLGVLIVIVNGIRLQFFESESGLFLKVGFFAIVVLIGIGVLLKWREQVFKFGKNLLLILSPFVLFTFSQAVSGFLTANPPPDLPITSQISAIQPKNKPQIKNRVVWIIFDELDYFVSFGANPRLIELPNFTKLKNESFFAVNAVSPAYATIESIPSLLTGKKIEKSTTLGKNELLLKFDAAQTNKFSQTPNIFRQIKNMNGATAAVGWYHPYCRVLGKDLFACQWESLDTINDFEPQPLSRIVVQNFVNCLISLPFGFRLFEKVNLKINGMVEDSGYLKRHYRMIEGSKAVLAYPDFDLIFIHLPFPHLPGQFNRQSNNFGTDSDFLDNLALTDKVLGEFRQTMENNNLWDNSTVIVSSDHQWRLNRYQFTSTDKNFPITQGIEHPNIPFILKLKGQTESVIYDKPFNTVITHDLILAIIKGEVSTAKDVQKWLDENIGKNP